ncbi:nickel pincer cofactor biosynthesis protein LarC [Metallumcola ferriviriculae]|uniref:Pyridinium-3,5-bisthiocarboxylic acid mononucleotide nickel insertion protein n=1 Tax=Metallumcola ferriviriculae TaxID=3039180 RepID=A0AAU0UH19_9FIRM|nr:nickel pincer cofactor biosynthesis protein LarC [Desulfitibacteraceae bacterium MK1]
MKTAIFQCPTGISGNMFLGALADAGLDWPLFLDTLQNNLPLEGYSLQKSAVVKNGLATTLVNVTFQSQDEHRHLWHIKDIIFNSTLPIIVKERSFEVFKRLAAAEAAAHNCSVEDVHFHEVGAIDAIVDIVGTVLALHLLGIKKIYCSPLPFGSGFVKCEHGTLPVPGPAVLRLMEGFPIGEPPPGCHGELTTPTGAALMTTLANFSESANFILEKTGFGAGSRDLPIPNAARVLIGQSGSHSTYWERISIIETNIDDMNPEFFGYLMQNLFQAGALDVFYTPVYMKGNRPGTLVTALCNPGDLQKLMNVFQTETTSLGFRFREETRVTAQRKFIAVNTIHGPVNVKISTFGTSIIIAPEYQDCLDLAVSSRVPLKEVYDEAKVLAWQSTTNNK